jgi:hypothetical protein
MSSAPATAPATSSAPDGIIAAALARPRPVRAEPSPPAAAESSPPAVAEPPPPDEVEPLPAAEAAPSPPAMAEPLPAAEAAPSPPAMAESPPPAMAEPSPHAVAEPPPPDEVVPSAPAEAMPSAVPHSPRARLEPTGFAPQPLPFGAAPPVHSAAKPDADPDWLAERLAREAATHDRSEWNPRWPRRLASWGAAGVLLALVAAGGLWLYEQSRVEGALVVVANTNPALPAKATVAAPRAEPAPVPPPASTTAPETAAMPSPAREEAPVAASTAQEARLSAPSTAETAAEPTVEAPLVKPVDASAAPERATRAAKSTRRAKLRADSAERPGDDLVDADPPRPRRSAAHKPAKTKTVASAAVREDGGSGGRSYRQRYEETLMQCRAHGYDERQCLQRGCEMTRYGFACKG